MTADDQTLDTDCLNRLRAGDTIHAALGIDPSRSLLDGTRPIPITEMGQPIRALFG